jgi:hypothetical protein
MPLTHKSGDAPRMPPTHKSGDAPRTASAPASAKVRIYEVAERPWGWLVTSAEVNDRVYVGSREWRQSSTRPPPRSPPIAPPPVQSTDRQSARFQAVQGAPSRHPLRRRQLTFQIHPPRQLCCINSNPAAAQYLQKPLLYPAGAMTQDDTQRYIVLTLSLYRANTSY